MALIVEDGTVVAGAESYITLANADAYHAARAVTSWAGQTTAAREAALRRATDYMVQAYRLRWKGTRVSATQALDWPRNWVERDDYVYVTTNGAQTIGGYFYYPADEVPTEVQNACAELALRSTSGDLYPDVTKASRTIREKVDVIEVEYSPYAPTETAYKAVDQMLAPLLSSTASGAVRKLVRV